MKLIDKLKRRQQIARWKATYKKEFAYIRSYEKMHANRGVEGIYPTGTLIARVSNVKGDHKIVDRTGQNILNRYLEIKAEK